jgi:hypothetical protein
MLYLMVRTIKPFFNFYLVSAEVRTRYSRFSLEHNNPKPVILPFSSCLPGTGVLQRHPTIIVVVIEESEIRRMWCDRALGKSFALQSSIWILDWFRGYYSFRNSRISIIITHSVVQ